MQSDILLQPSRWNILSELSKGPASASEIATKIHTSLPNVTQQLKILVAYDLVTELEPERGSVGKPKRRYQVKRSVAHVGLLRDGFAQRGVISPSNLQASLLNIILIKNTADQGPLLKFLVNNEEVIDKCAVAYLKSSPTDIEILLLTSDVENIRKKYSNTSLEFNGKQRKIIAWTHTLTEVQEGLAKNEKHFEIFKAAQTVIHDPQGEFNKVNR